MMMVMMVAMMMTAIRVARLLAENSYMVKIPKAWLGSMGAQ